MADQSEEFRSVMCAAVKEYIAAKSIEAEFSEIFPFFRLELRVTYRF